MTKMNGSRLSETSRVAEIGLGRRLRRTHLAFSHGLRIELRKNGFTFGQFVHLERLWDEDGLTQAELSSRVGVQMASSTSVLVELEELGLIRRNRSAEDRRKVIVHLTDAGRAAREPMLKRVKAANRAARKGMSPEEIQILFSLLDRAHASLQAHYV